MLSANPWPRCDKLCKVITCWIAYIVINIIFNARAIEVCRSFSMPSDFCHSKLHTPYTMVWRLMLSHIYTLHNSAFSCFCCCFCGSASKMKNQHKALTGTGTVSLGQLDGVRLQDTAFWNKGICLTGIPNCVAILPVLISVYQTLSIFEMFIVGPSWGYSFK